MKCQFLLLFFFFSQFCTFGQSLKPLNKDTLLIFDSTNVSNQIPDLETMLIYQEILEKTNEQLSLWFNPYVLIIGILAIFFTVMTIIAAIIIFRQSNEFKRLIKDSLRSHDIALKNLLSEKQKQYEIYDANANILMTELKQKLEVADGDKYSELKELIEKIGMKKSQLNAYEHIGWLHRDVEYSEKVDPRTNFIAKIKLASSEQSFVIYFRVLANNGKPYWIGFGGNIKNEDYRTNNEYTRHQIFSTTEITIQENVFSVFKKGFGSLNIEPVNIDFVRLRASDKNTNPVTFEFRFI
jgi:hypothetical protein